MVQIREAGAKMARKVTQDDIAAWKELRNKGYTYQKIGEETKWDPETVRKHIGGEQKPQENEKKEPEADLEIESRGFTEFEAGKSPVDLVKAKICSADVAKELAEKYGELSGKKFLSKSELSSINEDGYTKGFSFGFEEAKKKYLVKIPCTKCLKDLEITNPDLKIDLSFLLDSVISDGYKFLRGDKEETWGWHHKECPKK